MLSLVRFLEKKTLWVGLDETLPLNISSPLELLTDVCAHKGAGASYWQVDFQGPDSLSRAVGAYVSSQNAIKGLSVGLMSMSDVTRLNIDAKQTKSVSADSDFGNNSHYDLKVQSISQAIDIAECIRLTFLSIPMIEVKRCLFSSIEQKFVRIGAMNEKLIISLAKEDLLCLTPT